MSDILAKKDVDGEDLREIKKIIKTFRESNKIQ